VRKAPFGQVGKLDGKLAAAILSVSILSACAKDAYDTGAIPMAQSNLSLSLEICDARTTAFQSAGDFIECRLKAQQNYVAEIRLRQPEPFLNYAQRARRLAAQADANMVSRDDFLKQYGALVDELNTSIFQSQANLGQKPAPSAASGSNLQR
jgi:hypothetical protein